MAVVPVQLRRWSSDRYERLRLQSRDIARVVRQRLATFRSSWRAADVVAFKKLLKSGKTEKQCFAVGDKPQRSTRFGSPLVLSHVHWVEPKLVAEITYLTWTADNLLRETVYVGLREDKPAEEVGRER